MEYFITATLVLASLLWIIAGVRFYKEGSILKYLKHFGLLILTIFIYWLLIIYPILDCRSFLCGISELIWFLGLSYFTFIAWSIVIFYFVPYKLSPIKKDSINEF